MSVRQGLGLRRGALSDPVARATDLASLTSDPCMQRLAQGPTGVFHSCGSNRVDTVGCCSALHAPTGCSATWASTFSIYSHRYRTRLLKVDSSSSSSSSAAMQCAASWPCLFDSTDRETPCFSPVCSGLFSHEGDLTQECYRHVETFCAADSPTAPREQCDAFFQLASAEVCGSSGIEWRHCAAQYTAKMQDTIPERSTARRIGIKHTVAARFTEDEYGYYLLNGCETGRHRPKCPAAVPVLYDPTGNSTHPYFVRAAAFTVVPPPIPYYSPGNENLALVGMACALLVVMHLLDFLWFRSRKQFLDL